MVLEIWDFRISDIELRKYIGIFTPGVNLFCYVEMSGDHWPDLRPVVIFSRSILSLGLPLGINFRLLFFTAKDNNKEKYVRISYSFVFMNIDFHLPGRFFALWHGLILLMLDRAGAWNRNFGTSVLGCKP